MNRLYTWTLLIKMEKYMYFKLVVLKLLKFSALLFTSEEHADKYCVFSRWRGLQSAATTCWWANMSPLADISGNGHISAVYMSAGWQTRACIQASQVTIITIMMLQVVSYRGHWQLMSWLHYSALLLLLNRGLNLHNCLIC